MPRQLRTGPAFGYEFERVSTPSASGAATVADGSQHTTPTGAASVVGLVDDDGAAAFFGCSKRTFQDFMGAEFMPLPIRLGPRLRRWSIDELRAAVAGMPRETARAPQPTALRSRIEAMKGGGDAR